MKKLKFFFLFCIWNYATYGQSNTIEYEDWKILNLAGKVKTIQETSYRANKVNGKIVKSGKGWQYDWENDQEFHFDSLGYLVLINDLSGSKPKAFYTMKLDNERRIIEIRRLVSTDNYIYDSQGKVITSKETGKNDENKEQVSDYKYAYDSKNLLSKRERYQGGQKTLTEIFKYDNFDNLILCEMNFGYAKEIHTYSYDKDNLLIKHEWADEEGLAEVSKFEYINKIKTKELWEHYEEGEISGYIEEKFENGNLVETTETDPDGTIVLKEFCSYEFDQQGNWIKKIINIDGELFLVERVITYY